MLHLFVLPDVSRSLQALQDMVPCKSCADMAAILDFGNGPNKWRMLAVARIVPLYTLKTKMYLSINPLLREYNPYFN